MAETVEAAEYKILSGIDYVLNDIDKRVEAEEVVLEADLPAAAIPHLLAIGAIERVGEPVPEPVVTTPDDTLQPVDVAVGVVAPEVVIPAPEPQPVDTNGVPIPTPTITTTLADVESVPQAFTPVTPPVPDIPAPATPPVPEVVA